MTGLILAALFTITQKPSPIPPKALDSPTATGQTVTKNPKNHKAPSTQPPTSIGPSAADQQHVGSPTKSEDTQQAIRVRELPRVSITKDWSDWGIWAFNGLLVLVGVFQLLVLWRQAKIMKAQAEIMAEHAAHLKGLVTAAEDNAKAASAAAEAASKNADFSKLNAEATSQNAIAAKASADAAIASERAWVMVDLDKVPGVGGSLMYGTTSDAGGKHHYASVRVRCICSNQGKTPAKIIEKRAALILVTPENPLPLIPNLDIEIEDPVPHYLQSGGEHKSDWTPSTEMSISEDGDDTVRFFVVYGIVKYRHLFSEQIVHTTFGYRIRVGDVHVRLIDHLKYNENT